MSARNLHAAEQRTSEPRVRQAVTRTLDVLADVFPEILALPDGRMISLEVELERALVHALRPHPREAQRVLGPAEVVSQPDHARDRSS